MTTTSVPDERPFGEILCGSDTEAVPVDSLAAIREKLSGELGQTVLLAVTTHNSGGTWTFMAGRRSTLTGSSIDYTKTQFAEGWSEGYFDDRFVALVKSSANGQSHNVIACDRGSTDVSYVDWPDRYGFPSNIVLYD